MELKHIKIAKLCVSSANMRAKVKAPDTSDILPSIRSRGVLVPLIVRSMAEPDRYEIVAGRRRYLAACAVAEETGASEPLPCAIMAAGDDAAALEASILENVARLDPDEVARWESFTRLVREGRDPEEIALIFGLTELQVKRTLALGNLLARIRNLYRRGDIDATTVRHLTMATKAQQKAWLALVDDDTAHAPTGQQLKAWLFGGASIPVGAALFDVDAYEGVIVSDLFGEDRWFADPDGFWVAQRQAIDDRIAAYREAGWSDVVLLPEGGYFHAYEHQRVPSVKGGKVFVSVSHRGEVTFHEGYLTMKEVRAKERGKMVKPARPEVGSALQNYVDLHRHAAVRDALANRPEVALRVMVAHAIVGSGLWRVGVEPQRAHSDVIAESIEGCGSEAAFDAQRRHVLALIGFYPEAPTITGGYDGNHGVAGLLARLLVLPLSILALVMAETLDVGTPLIELLGRQLGVNMAKVWRANDALLDLIRDREMLGAILADVAGESVAKSNESTTGKVKRQIIRDCLAGINGRERVEGWVPRWMAFPPGSYTERGGIGSVDRCERIASLLAPPDAEPDTPSVAEPLRHAA